MSTFNCPSCNALHIDTPKGYITGCLCQSLKYKNKRTKWPTCDVCKKEMRGYDVAHITWVRCPRCHVEKN